MKSLSRVRLLVTPWTAAHQAPLSEGFSRQEYWSGVPLPWLGHLISIQTTTEGFFVTFFFFSVSLLLFLKEVLIVVSVQFSSSKYIHIVVRPISGTLHLAKPEFYTH